MGLDTTHDCWHGAYSSFMRWRAAVCEAAGWGAIHELPGYGGRPQGLTQARLEGLGFEYKNGAWHYPQHVLTVLLNHSDCDGNIAHKDTAPLADYLESLLPVLHETPLSEVWVHSRTKQFIAGLRLADSRGEDVEFH